MLWLLIARLIFTVVSLALGGVGVMNATQAGSNAMAGDEVGGGDWAAIFLPVIGSAVSALAGWFAPKWLPAGISAKETTEAAAAIIAWATDPKNPKKIRTAGLECLDVMFELVSADDVELQKLLQQVAVKFHEKYGRLPSVNGLQPASVYLQEIRAAENTATAGRKSR